MVYPLIVTKDKLPVLVSPAGQRVEHRIERRPMRREPVLNHPPRAGAGWRNCALYQPVGHKRAQILRQYLICQARIALQYIFISGAISGDGQQDAQFPFSIKHIQGVGYQQKLAALLLRVGRNKKVFQGLFYLLRWGLGNDWRYLNQCKVTTFSNTLNFPRGKIIPALSSNKKKGSNSMS